MAKATLGIQVHSGWGSLVAVTYSDGALTVLHRARIEITADNIAGGKQPFHFAENLGVEGAKRHLQACATASSRLAANGLRTVTERLQAENNRIFGCAILLASGRLLPPLESILHSHPLIHTAEGEFFRRIFWEGCIRLDIAVVGFRVRDLDDCATKVLDKASKHGLKRDLQMVGKSIGPPWTLDQKNAALAASLVLLGEQPKIRACSHEPQSLNIS